MDNQPPQGEIYNMTKRTLALAEDTNRIVRKMRRNQLWHTVFTIVWWLGIVGVAGAVYYYYFAPYVEQLLGLYASAQQVLQNLKP